MQLFDRPQAAAAFAARRTGGEPAGGEPPLAWGSPPPYAASTSPLYAALFLAFAILALFRIVINNRILDFFVNYTSEGGSILEKVHPATYGMCVVAVIVFLKFPPLMIAWELQVARAILIVAGIAAGLLIAVGLSGRSGSAGYLLDTYIALTTCLVMLAFPQVWRRRLGYALLGYVMVPSAILGMVEFAFHFRIMPYDEGELVFRPTGLTNHPLELGQWCTLGLCMYAGLNLRPSMRFGMCGLFLLGCLVSGARMATIAALLCSAVILIGISGAGLREPKRTRVRVAVIVAIAILGPLLVGVVATFGGFERFENGLADANASARFEVYGVLGSLSWQELLFGSDLDGIRKIISDNYGFDSIESSLLVFIIQFGLVGTMILISALVNLAIKLTRGANFTLLVALLSYFAVALTNNALSVKTSSVFLMVILAMAFRELPRTAAAGGRGDLRV